MKGAEKISAKGRNRGSRMNSSQGTEDALSEDSRFAPERRASLVPQLSRTAGRTPVAGTSAPVTPNPVNLRSLNRKGASAPSRR